MSPFCGASPIPTRIPSESIAFSLVPRQPFGIVLRVFSFGHLPVIMRLLNPFDFSAESFFTFILG
jgi:hypothetical protein